MNLIDFINKSSIFSLMPELCIVLAMFMALILSLFKKLTSIAWIIISPLLILGLSFCILLFGQLKPADSLYFFQGSFLLDNFALFLKGLILLVLLGLGLSSATNEMTARAEFLFLILGASLGACFLVSTNDLILLFVALETMSLSSIALISYLKGEQLSGEAGIKYLLNSAIASAFLLFAFSIIYGISIGSTNLSALPTLLFTNYQTFSHIFPFIIFALSLVLITVAIGFKLSLAPFHLWAPDVYNGAALPSTAFLATISKLAAFGLFCRLGWTIFGTNPITFNIWSTLFAIFAILSMFIGNLVGARQIFRENGSIKRLLAYSSIAQIGYIMSAAVLGPDWSLSQSLFYLTMYILIVLATFIGFIKFEAWFKAHNITDLKADDLTALKGLYKFKPSLAVFLGICFANLASVLPSMLIAKLILIDATIKGSLSAFLPKSLITELKLDQTPFMIIPQLSFIMALMIIVSSIIALFYYFAIIKMMFVDEPHPEIASKNNLFTQKSLASWFSTLVCTILLLGSIVLTIFPHYWASQVTSNAAQSLIVSSSNDLNKVLVEKKK